MPIRQRGSRSRPFGWSSIENLALYLKTKTPTTYAIVHVAIFALLLRREHGVCVHEILTIKEYVMTKSVENIDSFVLDHSPGFANLPRFAKGLGGFRKEAFRTETLSDRGGWLGSSRGFMT